jgi:hypothetical protein
MTLEELKQLNSGETIVLAEFFTTSIPIGTKFIFRRINLNTNTGYLEILDPVGALFPGERFTFSLEKGSIFMPCLQPLEKPIVKPLIFNRLILLDR